MSKKNLTKLFLMTLLFTKGQIGFTQLNLKEASSRKWEFRVPLHVLKSVKLPGGVQLEYAEQGAADGVPVIFLHGYTDSWHSFDQVLPRLPQSIHAYAVSQRGHGHSTKPASGYKPENFAADIAEFMEQLNIPSAIVVGHSMGATVAQRLALDYPQKIKALVMVASFASFKTNLGIAELKQIVAGIEDPVDPGFAYEFQKSTLYKPVGEELLKTYVKETLKVPARVWKATANEALNVDYTKDLSRITIPTLIIWGDKDLFSPRADQYFLNATIKHSTLLILQDTGHGIHWEDPQRFTKHLLDFIDSNDNKSNALELEFIYHYPAGTFER